MNATTESEVGHGRLPGHWWIRDVSAISRDSDRQSDEIDLFAQVFDLLNYEID